MEARKEREHIESNAKRLVNRLSGLEESKSELDIFTNDNNAIATLKQTPSEILDHAYLLAAKISDDKTCVRVCALLRFCKAKNAAAEAELIKRSTLVQQIEQAMVSYEMTPREIPEKMRVQSQEKSIITSEGKALYEELVARKRAFLYSNFLTQSAYKSTLTKYQSNKSALEGAYIEAALESNLEICAVLYSNGTRNKIAEKILNDSNELQLVKIIGEAYKLKPSDKITLWINYSLRIPLLIRSTRLCDIEKECERIMNQYHPKLDSGLNEIDQAFKSAIEVYLYSARRLTQEIFMEGKESRVIRNIPEITSMIANTLSRSNVQPLEILAAARSGLQICSSPARETENLRRCHPDFWGEGVEYQCHRVYFVQNYFSIEMGADNDGLRLFIRNKAKEVFIKKNIPELIQDDSIMFDPSSGHLMYSLKTGNVTYDYDVNRGISQSIYPNYLCCMAPLVKIYIAAYCHKTRNIVVLASTEGPYTVKQKLPLSPNESVVFMSSLGDDRLSCLVRDFSDETYQLHIYTMHSEGLRETSRCNVSFSSENCRPYYLQSLDAQTVCVVFSSGSDRYELIIIDLQTPKNNLRFVMNNDKPYNNWVARERDQFLANELSAYMSTDVSSIVRSYLFRDETSSSPISLILEKAKEDIEYNYYLHHMRALRAPLMQRFGLFAAEGLFTKTKIILERETSDKEKILELQSALEETQTLRRDSNLDNHLMDQGLIKIIEEDLLKFTP